jgi:broad specificity phosphatase PhoE
VSDRTTIICLVRHGSVVGAERRRFIGHLDVPLSPLGESQCASLATRLRGMGLCAIYTSDLARARRSGEIIGHAVGLRPALIAPLREISMGRWDGLTAAEIEAIEPDAFSRWMANLSDVAFPEGESVRDLAARAWPAIESLAARHEGETVAVVAHGGTNRAILCRAVGVPFDRLLAFGQDYAALTVLERRAGRWSLRRLNEALA